MLCSTALHLMVRSKKRRYRRKIQTNSTVLGLLFRALHISNQTKVIQKKNNSLLLLLLRLEGGNPGHEGIAIGLEGGDVSVMLLDADLDDRNATAQGLYLLGVLRHLGGLAAVAEDFLDGTGDVVVV